VSFLIRRDIMKRKLIIAVAIAVPIILVAGTTYVVTRNQVFADAFRIGRDTGQKTGYKKGYDVGFDKAIGSGGSNDPCKPFLVGGENGVPYSLAYPSNCPQSNQSKVSTNNTLPVQQALPPINRYDTSIHCTSSTYGYYFPTTYTDCW
jgi:hypothetical protein